MFLLYSMGEHEGGWGIHITEFCNVQKYILMKNSRVVNILSVSIPFLVLLATINDNHIAS